MKNNDKDMVEHTGLNKFSYIDINIERMGGTFTTDLKKYIYHVAVGVASSPHHDDENLEHSTLWRSGGIGRWRCAIERFGTSGQHAAGRGRGC